jgi:N-acetylmuramoyl-L-alanine amidase
MRAITEIIIHATATRPNWWASKSAKQKVQEVRRWHVEDNGWAGIGYHYLIDRDGTVVKGRPIERAGAHVRGHNKDTIGIALFGGHGGAKDELFSANFTREQGIELRRLIVTLQDKYGQLKLSGHHEYANKACPCFDVQKWYVKIPHYLGGTTSTANPFADFIAAILKLFGRKNK